MTSIREGGKGYRCELIATDGGTGLHAARIQRRVQRCWAHKTRNVWQSEKERSAMVKKAKPSQPCCQPTRSDTGYGDYTRGERLNPGGGQRKIRSALSTQIKNSQGRGRTKK